MERTTRQPWLGIELRHLAALCAVAREGSFRGAADSLGYVQSAVSQQLAYLERLVGAPLVVRRRGQAPVALTEQGELLLGHFSDILGRISAAHADVEALRDGRAGRLRVGLFESAATRLMPPILTALGRTASTLRVELQESRDAAAIAEQVEAGTLDVAFGVAPLPPGPFEGRHLLTDPYVLLAPASWSLPPEPSADEVAALRLVGADSHREEDLRSLGVEPGRFPHSTGDAAVQGLVAAGIGAAILPRLAVAPEAPRMQVVDLGHLMQPRQVVLFWHRDRAAPAALDVFLELAAQACSTLGAVRPPMALAA
jgi:DNA-binding transcriptional LysR family regulator